MVIAALVLSQFTIQAQRRRNTANSMMRVNASVDTSDEVFPRFWSQGVAFASNRKAANGAKRDYDLYEMRDTADTNVMLLKGKLKSRFNETSPFITKNGNTLYFSRNGFDGNFARRNRIGKLPMKSFVMQKKGNRWRKMRPLPFNNNDYSVAHVVLNDSEDKLYFVSDMPGGYGGMDIYVVRINADGTYGEPENMGDGINTPSDETSPFMVGDDTLYFASEGHQSMGGLDIFKADLSSQLVENLGPSVNSIFDDYGFILDIEKSHAFFSSTRGQEEGRSNIYFTKYDTKKESTPSKEQEEMIVENDTVRNDERHALNSNIMAHNVATEVDKLQNDERHTLDSSTKAYNLDAEFARLQKVVYFEFDKKVVQMKFHGPLNEVAAFLRAHSEARIILVGHTDTSGNKDYNQKLSLERANYVKEYLMLQGISTAKISVFGKGEEEPAKDCEDCPKKLNAQNRRVELKLEK